jgi:hypothetical protein
MSRPSKPLQVRPVDDLHAAPPSIVRLTNGGEEKFKDTQAPVVLGPGSQYTGPKDRIKLTLREDLETRSFEPSVETLIAAEHNAPELLENDWGDNAKNAKPIPWGWFALLALTMAAGTIWSLFKIEKSEKQSLDLNETAQAVTLKENEDELNAARLIDKMDALLRSFHNATSIGALVPLVRDSTRVRPLMERHYGENPVPLVKLRSIRSLTPLTIGSSANFWVASVNQSGETVKNILIEVNDAGEPLIDWETYVCYQPMPWDDYVTKRPAGISLDFRVMARPDSLFSHEFNSPSQWLCFQLNAPGSMEFLYGYARADSEVASQVANLVNQNGGKETSMILRLYIPEKIESKRGVVIEKLLAKQWLFIEPPASAP